MSSSFGARRATVAALLAIGAVVSGCTSDGGSSDTASPVAETAPAAAPASVTASIPDAAPGLTPAEPLVITATDGVLRTVEVSSPGPDGAPVPLPGALAPDGTVWTSAPLEWGTPYSVRAVAVNADGVAAPELRSAFGTVPAPARTLDVEDVSPDAGQVVGIAMPVSIRFDRPVTDRAAVERRLAVTTSVPTTGSFHWFSDERVNWRPLEYWKPGTRVTVTARLRGVDTGGGLLGGTDVVSDFVIGRDQRVFGDVNTHTLVAFENGAPVRTMPASYGRSIYPTQYGIHVVMERYEVKRMRSDTWGGPAEGEPGFYDDNLPHAVRISNNGEFVHVNAATVSDQGRRNVSHGCVNLSPENGAWFFGWAQMGDPVEIVGSSRPLTRADGDIADWTIPWPEYVAGSALPPPPAPAPEVGRHRPA